jgi:hypothetical protein
MGPEPRGVEGLYVAQPLGGCRQLRHKGVSIGALPTVVVESRGQAPGAQACHCDPVIRQRAVAEHEPVHEVRVAQRQVLGDHPAEVASGDDDALQTAALGDQGVQIAAAGGAVALAVRAEARLPEPAQIGDDHVEPRGHERADHAPVEPLGLRPAVDEQ